MVDKNNWPDRKIHNIRLLFFNIVRITANFDWLYSSLIQVIAVLSGLLVAGVLIACTGASILESYKALIFGAFGSLYAVATTLNRATPLILAGLGVTFAFRAGIWNVGAEGQICVGGLTATIAGVYLNGLPAVIHLPLALLAGFVGGSVWGGIAGFLKAKYNVNDIISCLMMNYIAINLVSWLVRDIIRDSAGIFPQSFLVLPSSRLPIILPETRLHAGLILALIAAIAVYIILWRSTFGYDLRIVGANVKASRYSGMNVVRIQILAMLISGGLAGLAGAVEILGAQYRLRDAFLLGYGYDAIAVAMLGQLNPIGVVMAAIFFGGLRSGAGTMQRTVNIPSSLVFVVQGVVVIFVIGASLLRKLPARLANKETINASNPP